MWALTLCPREARYCAENSRRFAPAQGRALRYWACTRRGGGLDAILSRALAEWASYFGDGTLRQSVRHELRKYRLCAGGRRSRARLGVPRDDNPRATHQRDVLFAIQFIGDRRPHAGAQAGL